MSDIRISVSYTTQKLLSTESISSIHINFSFKKKNSHYRIHNHEPQNYSYLPLYFKNKFSETIAGPHPFQASSSLPTIQYEHLVKTHVNFKDRILCQKK